MALIEELRTVMRLAGELPEDTQRALAMLIGRMIEEHEEETTMTKRQVARLRALEDEKRLERHNYIRKFARLKPVRRWPPK